MTVIGGDEPALFIAITENSYVMSSCKDCIVVVVAVEVTLPGGATQSPVAAYKIM